MPREIPKNNEMREQAYYAIQKRRILGKLKYIVPKEYPEMSLSDIESVADELLEAYSVEGVKKLTDEELKKMLTIKVDTRKQINVMRQMYKGALFSEKAIEKEEKVIRERESAAIEAVKKHAKDLNSERYKTKKSRQELKKTIENNEKLKKKDIKISKKTKKQKSIGKPILVAAMLGMMTVGGTAAICSAGANSITVQMEEAGCFDDEYYSLNTSDKGLVVYKNNDENSSFYKEGKYYGEFPFYEFAKEQVPKAIRKGFTEDEAVIGICKKYGGHPSWVAAKKSTVSSRIVTEFKAGTEEINKALKTSKSRGLK